MRVFVTGTAGFIGFHLARRLLADGHEVVGYDGMTPYYDVALKRARHALLRQSSGFVAIEAMLEDSAALNRAVADFAPEIIVHLAAQAGVRYSLEAPQTYIDTNLTGMFNLLEAARQARPSHLLFASTSSVYGGNEAMPFAEVDRTDFPVSLYAATKKAGEAMSHAHAHLHGLPTTCFRFFTVYGPWGRPDMALFKFVSAIERGETIEVYGMGRMRRDFTYIDDLVEAIVRLMATPPESGQPVPIEGGRDSLSPVAPWRSVNIAGGQQVELMDFIAAIETQLGRQAEKIMLPMQAGDVVATEADARLLAALIGYVPQTRVAEGVAAFVEWYRDWRQGGGAG
ncbi:MAG: SDR family NAD(P)-dependent oxidoreductase [Devosia sp.]|nr:SDR family NAD(P)-dependent oxidoreductase [Devosia sp.]